MALDQRTPEVQRSKVSPERSFGLPGEVVWNWIMIRHINDARWRALDRITAGWGLTGRQYVTLFMLYFAEQPVRQRDVGRWLFQEQTSVSDLVKRMEAKGLITRQRSPEDRREILIEPTEEGREVVQELYEAVRKTTTDFLSSIDVDDHAHLGRILSKLRQGAFRELGVSPDELDRVRVGGGKQTSKESPDQAPAIVVQT